MNAPRRATLFTNGSNQAIRIPRDFELTGKEALIRKEGDRLIIEPAPPPRLLAPAHGPARPRGKPSTRLRKARTNSNRAINKNARPRPQIRTPNETL